MKNKKQRSLEENAYYWSVVVAMLAAYFHTTPYSIHSRIKKHYKINSTATLNTIKFEWLMSEVRLWSMFDLGMVIPLPNEDFEMPVTGKKRVFLNDFNLELLPKVA